jgi:hypothetical protein
VDETRRLERLPAPLAAQMCAGDLLELEVNVLDQALARRLATAAQGVQQPGHLTRRGSGFATL